MNRLCILGNAASIHALRWAAYFANKGWIVSLITWRRPRSDYALPRAVVVYRLRFPPHYALRWLALAEAALLINRIRPDIIHAHYVGTFGIIAGLYCKMTGFRPLVVSAWGSHGLTHARGVGRRLRRLAFSMADKVHIDGNNMFDVVADYGVPRDNVVLIHYGTDVTVFSPDARNRGLCSRWPWDDAPVVISVRTLEPLYDVATFVRAAARVVREVPTTRFVIAGDGSQRTRLEALASELGLKESVHFVGRLAETELTSCLASSDIYVSTSLSDAGLAASTAEAMACGLPAVVTDFGDNATWVKDGETGYLFPCGDAGALAERLLWLLQDGELRRRLGANGRREIVERNSYQGEMQKVESIYADLIEMCRRSAS